jgi:hypothetical protein
MADKDKKNDQQTEPCPPTITQAGVVIKRDDKARYVYYPPDPMR